ncbi:hypothetical protein FB451DRAFT_1514503 [Mycena latifolia]|nr:hypothetical protein FB451DRAFT_1514503 [Mycena latifolia]
MRQPSTFNHGDPSVGPRVRLPHVQHMRRTLIPSPSHWTSERIDQLAKRLSKVRTVSTDVVIAEPAPNTLQVLPHTQYHSHDALDPASVAASPLDQFHTWLADAVQSGKVHDPEAMSLSTATPQGIPSGRMVLLKQLDPRGFVFFTNYTSRKSQELLANPPRARSSRASIASRSASASSTRGRRPGRGRAPSRLLGRLARRARWYAWSHHVTCEFTPVPTPILALASRAPRYKPTVYAEPADAGGQDGAGVDGDNGRSDDGDDRIIPGKNPTHSPTREPAKRPVTITKTVVDLSTVVNVTNITVEGHEDSGEDTYELLQQQAAYERERDAYQRERDAYEMERDAYEREQDVNQRELDGAERERALAAREKALQEARRKLASTQQQLAKRSTMKVPAPNTAHKPQQASSSAKAAGHAKATAPSSRLPKPASVEKDSDSVDLLVNVGLRVLDALSRISEPHPTSAPAQTRSHSKRCWRSGPKEDGPGPRKAARQTDVK